MLNGLYLRNPKTMPCFLIVESLLTPVFKKPSPLGSSQVKSPPGRAIIPSHCLPHYSINGKHYWSLVREEGTNLSKVTNLLYRICRKIRKISLRGTNNILSSVFGERKCGTITQSNPQFWIRNWLGEEQGRIRILFGSN